MTKPPLLEDVIARLAHVAADFVHDGEGLRVQVSPFEAAPTLLVTLRRRGERFTAGIDLLVPGEAVSDIVPQMDRVVRTLRLMLDTAQDAGDV